MNTSAAINASYDSRKAFLNTINGKILNTSVFSKIAAERDKEIWSLDKKGCCTWQRGKDSLELLSNSNGFASTA